MDEILFKVPHKMTNEWIDYAENVHVRTPFKYPANNNSLINNNNSFLTTNMHQQQPPQQFYNKMGIKPFNNNLNNNNSNALNQYSLTNKFQKPSRGELIDARENLSPGFRSPFGKRESHFINREMLKLLPIVFPPRSGCVCRKQFLTPSLVGRLRNSFRASEPRATTKKSNSRKKYIKLYGNEN